MKPTDTIQLAVSDFHSGSNYALFLKRNWHGAKGASHTPNSKQLKIREHFETFCEEVKQARKGKKIKLIHNGDAIDGDHHHSGDVCTLNMLDQADIHIELMAELQKRIGWERGDELYYTRGTQSHVNELENYIGREANAIPDGEFYVHDLLRLETNGVESWFVHHGKNRGDGANEGNSLRNWLRGIHYDALKDKRKTPDIIYTGHVHDPTYSVYTWREKMDFKLMHGIILPSWQMKTVYAHAVAPVSVNKIGGVYHEIKADGTVTIPKFRIIETQ